ncbi:MAG: tRNA (N6-threonylcarbamoyladenosine(37)-N6)-methyltransferase TrmO [Oscillospiraceae bacterium]|nr:tRNA (N6-threonylcarbamoyladenosine(37)-N6)-methyltransferase TrmO [Oscillospiraceae bacterium]
METVARIYNDLGEKFGVPRQSGMTDMLSLVRLEPPYNVREALRGIEGCSHLWLLWLFSENPPQKEFSPTVRPPRLGGNRRLGVFATRSPFRPNGIGLSVVRLVSVDEEALTLTVQGADLVNGTPIIDIKPYIPYADCVPDAVTPYCDHVREKRPVYTGPQAEGKLPSAAMETLKDLIAQDPRPQYHGNGREYTFSYAGRQVTFRAEEDSFTILGIE